MSWNKRTEMTNQDLYSQGENPQYINETPVKKGSYNYQFAQDPAPFNSQDVSADELADYIETQPSNQYNTLAPGGYGTPVNGQSMSYIPNGYTYTDTNGSPYITQPTQIIHNPAVPHTPESRVQVPASSPTPAYSQSPGSRNTPGGSRNVYGANTQRPNGFAKSLAPQGTVFRPPLEYVYTQQPRAPQAQMSQDSRPINPYINGSQNDGAQSRQLNHNVIDLEEEEDIGMPYRGTYSDEESQIQRKNIKPSSVRPPKRSRQNSSSDRPQQPQQSNSQLRFKVTLADFYHNPRGLVHENIPPVGGRKVGDITGAYVGHERSPKKPCLNSHSSQLTKTMTSLDDITDFELRSKVERGTKILPSVSIDTMAKAIIRHKGNFDDALSSLVEDNTDAGHVDLTFSSQDDDELSAPATQRPAARVMTKQTLKNHRTINEKYGITAQTATKKPPQIAQKLPSIEKDSSEDHSPIKPQAKRKRLVQASRKNQPPPKAQSPIAITDDDDEELDDETQASESDGEKPWVGSLVKFFNNCSVADLVDMANVKAELAEHILAHRPFKTYQDIRKIKEPERKGTTKKGKKTGNRNVGERIYETCSTMWTGYEAVDMLVDECAKFRRKIFQDMKKWGVDVIGASKDGELELVNLETASKSSPQSFHDSGIGTPNISGDEKVTNSNSTLIPQPEIMSKKITMKDYQVIGMNWLNILFRNKLGGILADDMGLGKTCQIIAFLAHLKETGVQGPHVIVVPSSTLENWLREFANFCPDLQVTSYYGSQDERRDFRDEYREMKKDLKPYIMITTYSVAARPLDRSFLDKIRPTCAIFDEGHALKNGDSKKTGELMKIHATFRVLLTGTPLQNNLLELMTLLEFIMPATFEDYGDSLGDVFKHRAKTTDDDHSSLLSAQRIRRARSMVAPFILRRKKDQVLQHLPTKTTRIEYCDLNATQRTIYGETMARAARILSERQNGAKATKASNKESANVMFDLRKACIHPLLFRRHFKDDATIRKLVKSYIRNPANAERNKDYCFEDFCVMDDFQIHNFCMRAENEDYMAQHGLDVESFLDSGKIDRLIALLQGYKANGDRVLLFSQFTMVLDILEVVLGHESLSMKFYRIDGSTPVDQRQALIDRFYAEEDVTCFMLSTKAGGAGINLAAANKVIIFDQSFNPQDDIQAENRAHRVGQTRPVEVVRMVTRNTIEEKILGLGESKVLLDEKVAGNDGGEGGGKGDDKVGNMGEKMVREALERDIAAAKVQEKEGGRKGEEKEEVKEEDKKGGKKKGDAAEIVVSGGKKDDEEEEEKVDAKTKGAGDDEDEDTE